MFVGKSLIEKAIQTAEKEENAENEAIKSNADLILFLSVEVDGVNKYDKVEDYEHIFNIYSKRHDYYK